MEILRGMPLMLDAWLTLYYTPKIGAVRFKLLVDHFGSAENAIAADNLAWQAAGIPTSVLQTRAEDISEKVHKALQWAEADHHHILHFKHALYPPLLKEIFDPPMILFLKGNPELLSSPQIAIVGARKPTQEGFYNAHLFAAELASAGLTITSGLALGIDYTAHNAAVKLEKPTIAVLGTGLNQIYPKSHYPLSEAILETGGALISEYPLHMPAKPQNFPRRNRIIAGLALGTLVVEAAPRSGSLITARISIEENRDVFAIPGSIHEPQSRGCHELIRNGAILVESTIDIRTSLTGGIDTDIHENTKQDDLFTIQKSPSTQDLATPQKRTSNALLPNMKVAVAQTIQLPVDHPQYDLYNLLTSPHSINQLVETLNRSASDITTDLMMLEIEGVITAEQGFYQQKASK